MLNIVYRVLTINEVRELHESAVMLAGFYAGRVDPRALNELYTNKENIPEEFR